MNRFTTRPKLSSLTPCVAVSLLLLFLLAAVPALAQPAPAPANPAESLIGLWSAERVFGPEVAGELVVRERSGSLIAEIAGFEAPVKRDGDEVRFDLPGDRGAFRGRFSGEPPRLQGHWIQPWTRALRGRYATPVGFEQRGAAWVGQVTPLVDRLRLYLSVTRDDAGVVRAFLRNPERNLGIYHRIHRIEVDGPVVRLLREGGELALEGRYHNGDGIEALALYLPFPGVSFDLRRADRGQATAFYPWPDRELYTYRVPRPEADGWETAHAGEQGLRVEPLQDLVRRVRDTVTDSIRSPYVHSILVAHKGKLVLDEYFYGFHSGEPHDTRSSGKSLSSMIVGAALDDDRALDTGRTLQSIFGERAAEPRGTDAEEDYRQRAGWRGQVTLGDLLSMSSGLACDDDDSESPGNEDRMQNQDDQPDWVRFALDVPMARAPGRKAVYCSNSINLAAAAVARAQNAWLPEFFDRRLAQPLGIRRYHFNLDPSGAGYMGGGIRLTPRDQLKLAQVMLDDGVWRGTRVLSSDWVAASLAPHGSIHEADDYGYGWWRKTLDFDGRPVEVFHASGNGGQFFIGIPELDLAVQFSGGNYGNFPVWYTFLTDLVPKYILPAAGR